jgi:gamma-glutamylcyclotransferase (GGCT)/AIG2-like uncharacterized protein YtfP
MTDDNRTMTADIFIYGSLMFPQVWEKVVRGRYRSAPAVVAGHARHAIIGETYPGMVAAPGESVSGVVVFGVSAGDMALLDAFEGSDYRRANVLARLESGEGMTVGTYLWLDPARLADAPWLPETFQLQRFLDTYCQSRLAD